MIRQITDTRAAELIHEIMNGQEWSPDTLNEIADVLRLTGREIDPPWDEDS